MKKPKKFLCLILAMVILIPNIAIFGNVFAQTADTEPLKIEVTTDKSSYTAYGIAEITVKVTNTSDEPVNNISAEAVFEQLAPVGKNNETFKEIESLQSGESFTFSYKATLNANKVNINFFEKIILWFVRLFNGGYNATSHNIEAVTEDITQIKFGNYVVQNIVKVEYDKKNIDIDDFKFIDFHSNFHDIYINQNEQVTFTAIIETNTQIPNESISVFDNEDNFICYLNSTDNNITFEGTVSVFENSPKNIEYYAKYNNVKSDTFKICFYKEITESEFNSFDDVRNTINEMTEKADVIKLLESEKAKNKIESYYDNGDSVVFTSTYGITCVWIDEDYFEQGYKRVTLDNKDNSMNNTPSGNTYQEIINKINSSSFSSSISDKDVILIRPYRNSDFPYDDFLTTGEIIADALGGNIDTYDNENATLSVLKTLDNYGVILFDSHGYLDRNTNETYICLTQTYTDTRTAFSSDYWGGRIIVMSNGRIYVHSDFFEKYYDNNDFSNSLVFLGTCYSMYNDSFADTFISKGVSCVYGFTNVVSVSYCNNTLAETVLENLLLDCESSSKAYSDTISVCGKSDPNRPQTEFVTQQSKPINLCKANTTITGTVKDSSTNEIIDKLVTIKIIDSNNIIVNHTKADKNGAFSVNVPVGDYTILIECEGYVSNNSYITVGNSNTNFNLGTILLKSNSSSESNTSSVHGTVIDSETQRAISNVKVTLYSEDTKATYTTVTDEIGDFSFENLTAGRYTLSFEHEDYTINETNSFTLDEGLMFVFTDPFEFAKKSSSGEDDSSDTGDDSGETTDPVRTVTASGNCGANGDNVTWTLYDDGELVISGSGAMADWSSSSSVPWYSYRNYIKSVNVGNGVTTIGNYAFYNYDSLTSATIGNSITTIGYKAFSCTGLMGINVDSNNAHYSSDSYGVLFNKDKTKLIKYPDSNARTSYTIPDSVTTIHEYAFEYCTSLASVTISDSVTSIGNYAFYSCNSLTSVTISNSVTSIGSDAFSNCTSLASITIPDSVTSLGNYAFHKCTNLTSATIGNSITSIGKDVFSYCVSLTSITIPDSVMNIGSDAFAYCSGLTSITIPESVTSIGSCAFYGCTSLASISIPDNVTSLGNYVFHECTSLKSVTIGNSVTSIGTDAFSYCRSLTSVTIPDSVTSIGNYAFYECTGIKSATIGNSVTSIGNYAFYFCNSLTSITIGNNVMSIGDYAFYDCSYIEYVHFPDSVTSIGDRAFYSCDNLTSVTIPDSVTSIGDSVFFNCHWLTSATIGNSVTSISKHAFGNCSNLKNIIIGNSVTSIEDNAFSYCRSLTSVTIPDSVTSIGTNVFIHCESLTSIVVDADNEFYSCDTYGVLFNKNKTKLIQYPIGNTRTSYIIPDSVTIIGDSAFSYCTNLTSVTIPNSVTSLGRSAFYYCDNLISITIPNSVTSIEENAFYYCESLTNTVIPNSVTNIGDWAFYNCYSLTDVYYSGTEEEWSAISIGSDNLCLTNATIHYNS